MKFYCICQVNIKIHILTNYKINEYLADLEELKRNRDKIRQALSTVGQTSGLSKRPLLMNPLPPPVSSAGCYNTLSQ